jgi:hypothetical protein
MKINLPEGYEIDKEKSTFDYIVFKKKNPALGRSIYSLLNKPEQKYKPIYEPNRKFTIKHIAGLMGKSTRTVQRYCDLCATRKTKEGYKIYLHDVQAIAETAYPEGDYPLALLELLNDGGLFPQAKPKAQLPQAKPKAQLTQAKRKAQLTYIIKDYSTGLYKIGKSNNPQQRERTLQSEKPTIKTVKVFNSDVESLLHKEFADVRVRGEWFKLNKVQLTRICTQYD